jgi:hypothetical protein
LLLLCYWNGANFFHYYWPTLETKSISVFLRIFFPAVKFLLKTSEKLVK